MEASFSELTFAYKHTDTDFCSCARYTIEEKKNVVRNTTASGKRIIIKSYI